MALEADRAIVSGWSATLTLGLCQGSPSYVRDPSSASAESPLVPLVQPREHYSG